MTLPQLAPELIGQIQDEAEVGQAPEAIKQLRRTFELVNKQWKGLVDHFSYIIVLNYHDLARLTAKLAEPGAAASAGTKTKAIYINLRELEYTGHLPEVVKVLEKIGNCERAELVHDMGWASLTSRISRDDATKTLKADLLAALANLTKLRHFHFSGNTTCEGCNSTSVEEDVIKQSVAPWFGSESDQFDGADRQGGWCRFARDWPKLETLEFVNCDLDQDDDDEEEEEDEAEAEAAAGLFSGFSNLKALSYKDGLVPEALAALVKDFPSTVHKLEIGCYRLYFPPSRGEEPACMLSLAQLEPQAHQLTEFYLLDPAYECYSRARGLYDGFVLALVNVKKLTISPLAVSDVSELPAALPQLEHLVLGLREPDPILLQEMDEPVPTKPEVKAKEVIAMLDARPSKLKTLEIWADKRARYSKKEQAAIKRAADKGGVKLKWVTSYQDLPYTYHPV